MLTANATTPYSMAFPNLEKTGPLVFEIPAGASAGGITGAQAFRKRRRYRVCFASPHQRPQQ